MKLMIRFFLFFLGVASSHAALTNSYQKTVNLLQGHGIEFDSATAQKAAISAYVKEIDPHAKYLSNEESNILLGAQTGQFYYLGCSLTFSNAVPEIAAVVESSPAANSGLKVGHIIQRINGLDLAGLRFAEVLDRLRIFDSKALELKVLDGETETKLVVTPQEIRPVSIQKIEILPFNIGYIKLNGLYPGTTENIRQVINQWVADGLLGLVIDLRNANGTDFESIPQIVDIFCMPKKELFRVEETQSKKVRIYRDPGNVPAEIPLICLINKQSSGASEILAACLKEVAVSTVLIGENSSGDMGLRSFVRLDEQSQFYLSTKNVTVNQTQEFTGVQSVHPDILVDDVNIPAESISRRAEKAAEKDHVANEAILLKTRISFDACLQRAADIMLALKALNVKNR